MLVAEKRYARAEVLDPSPRNRIQWHFSIVVQLRVVFEELILVTGEGNTNLASFERAYQLTGHFVELEESLVDVHAAIGTSNAVLSR